MDSPGGRSVAGRGRVLTFKDTDIPMDLNELFYDHQVALMRADAADDDDARRDYRVDASRLAARIRDRRATRNDTLTPA